MTSEDQSMKDELVALLRKPLERMWNAVSKEKTKGQKIECIATVYIESLRAKHFMLEKGLAKIPLEKLEKEPKEAANELASVLERIE